MHDQKISLDPEAAVSDLDTSLYAAAIRGSAQLRIGYARFRQWLGIDRVLENVQTANYTLALADVDRYVVANSASALTFTVPPNSSVAFPIGSVIPLYRHGTGTLTVAQGSGVTVRTASSLTLRAQYSEAALRKRGTDEWVLSGDLT